MWITFDRKLRHFPGLNEETTWKNDQPLTEPATGDDNLECAGVLLAEGECALGAWFVRGSMVSGTTVYPRKLLFGAKYPEDCDPAWHLTSKGRKVPPLKQKAYRVNR